VELALPLPAAFVQGLQALPNDLFAKFQVRRGQPPLA
jgi:hypothetical protein